MCTTRSLPAVLEMCCYFLISCWSLCSLQAWERTAKGRASKCTRCMLPTARRQDALEGHLPCTRGLWPFADFLFAQVRRAQLRNLSPSQQWCDMPLSWVWQTIEFSTGYGIKMHFHSVQRWNLSPSADWSYDPLGHPHARSSCQVWGWIHSAALHRGKAMHLLFKTF